MVWNLGPESKKDLRDRYPKSVCTACGTRIQSATGRGGIWCAYPTLGNANPYAWVSFYRVVIVYNNTHAADMDMSHPQKTYKLSGVGVMDAMVRDNFEVPSDRNMRRRRFRQFDSYAWRRLEDTLFIPPADLLIGKNDDESVYGFPVHANCWTLIERLIGPLAEQHLDILLGAMLDAWDQGGKKARASVSSKPKKSPLHIADVKRLVKKLTRRGAVHTKPRGLVSTTLPLEIMYMIFDPLDHDELELVLEATGWAVSEEYYRSRTRFHGLIFEIEALRSRVDLDWLPFYREAEEVLEMSDGFKTRCNIIKRLSRTRKQFLSRLASEMGHMVVWIFFQHASFVRETRDKLIAV